MCKDMAGYNESLTVNYQQDNQTMGKEVMYKKKMMLQKERYMEETNEKKIII